MRAKFRRLMWTFGVAAVLVSAVTLSALRLLLPQMPSYRADIETWLTQTLGYPVHIGAISAELRGVGAALRFSDVTLQNEQQTPVFAFHQVLVDVDLWGSLLAARLELGQVTLIGVDVEVIREVDGSIAVADRSRTYPTPIDRAQRATGYHSGLRWLLERDYINLVNSSLRWRDRTQGDTVLTFTDLRLSVTNDGKRHRIGGESVLPAEFGKSVRFVVDAYGDVLDGSAWSATLYVRTEALHIGPVRTLFMSSTLPTLEGVLDSEVWVNWREGTVISTVGSLNARAPVLLGKYGRWGVESAQAQFNWRVIPDGWLFNLSRWQLGDGDQPHSALVVRQRGGNEPSLEIATNRIELDMVGQIATASNALSAEQREAVLGLRLHGRLNDAYLRVQKNNHKEAFFLTTQFNDLGFQAWRRVPGASGLEGSLELDTQAARLQLNSQSARLDVPGVFRKALSFDILAGDVVARHSEEGWNVWSDRLEAGNRDIQTEGSFQLKIPNQGSPELDLAANFRNGRAAATSRYLPAGVMPPAAVAWLDRAIVDGSVPAGGVIFRGPLDQFPFRKAQGRFEVRFTVEDGILDYVPRWPRLEQVQAEVVFREQGMHIQGHRAHTLEAEVENVQIDIDDLSTHKSILRVQGRAHGPASTGLAFLTTTPLGDTVGQRMRNWRVTGNTEVDLDLAIPLIAGASNEIAGTVRLEGNGIYPTGPDVDILDVRGLLIFSRDGIYANKLTANVMGQAAVVDITTAPDNTVLLTANGTTSGLALAERFNVKILRWLQGPLVWQGTLRLPRRGAAAELEIRSGLQNVLVETPYPLGKKLKERRDSQVNLVFGGDVIPVQIRYGNQVSAAFALENRDRRWIARRGDVRIGQGDARLPSDDGLHVFARVDKLDIDAWRKTIASTETGSDTHSTEMTLREIDLEAAQARVLSRRFKDVHVAAVNSPDGWHIDMVSDKVAGTMTAPQRPNEAIVIDLARLYIEPAESVEHVERSVSTSPSSTYDPRTVREFQLSAADFRYADWILGPLQLNTERRPEGLRFTGLTLGEAPTNISAQGSWLMTSTGASSRWHVDVRTDDVDRTLRTFGYANAIRNGSGSAKMDLTWTGGPADFALRRLDGNINIEIAQGRLLDVEPGAGRIFGLLSLQALPRRLTLDFSDLFSKGFAFDRIGGDFVITQGIAHTPNLIMEGPAAAVQVTGLVNLYEKSYDQRVKVLPNVTSSLPLAIGVAATPLAGAAAWLAEKLLRDPVSDLAQANYRVTGSWQNPKIEPVSRAAVTGQSELSVP